MSLTFACLLGRDIGVRLEGTALLWGCDERARPRIVKWKVFVLRFLTHAAYDRDSGRSNRVGPEPAIAALTPLRVRLHRIPQRAAADHPDPTRVSAQCDGGGWDAIP